MVSNANISGQVEEADYTSLSDQQLVARLVEHDPNALAAIYDRYIRPIYSLAIKMMGRKERAEEVVQEVFIKLWRKPYSYDPQRGAFINWILGVTHNQAIDELQRERNHERTVSHALPNVGEEEQAIDVPDPNADPAEEAWFSVRMDIVRQALQRLPSAQRQVVELAYFSGLTQAEIAARLTEPLGTIKTRTRLALQKLKVILEEEDIRGER
jgi:RNA polymerase sigma-70 factor (ECF subfamily)